MVERFMSAMVVGFGLVLGATAAAVVVATCAGVQ